MRTTASAPRIDLLRFRFDGDLFVVAARKRAVDSLKSGCHLPTIPSCDLWLGVVDDCVKEVFQAGGKGATHAPEDLRIQETFRIRELFLCAEFDRFAFAI